MATPPERDITFEEGLLGITLKRSVVGRAVVSEINEDTQAASNGVVLNDVVRQVGSRDLRNEALDKKAWLELIDLLKTSPRPLVLVVSTGTEEEIKQKPKKSKNSSDLSADKKTGGDEGVGKEEVVLRVTAPVTTPAPAPAATPTTKASTTAASGNASAPGNKLASPSSSDTVPVSHAAASSSKSQTTNPLQQQDSSVSNDSSIVSTDDKSLISSSTTTTRSATEQPFVTMDELAQCLEWPSKGPLSKGATDLIGGKRSIEQLLKHGTLKLWANRGWFGGSNLQSRHVFLCNTILLVCELSKDDEKKQIKLSKKGGGGSRDWQDMKWVVETAIELEACLIRDVPPKPLQGVNDDELRGAFEVRCVSLSLSLSPSSCVSLDR
jgi:hypothetical protein